VSDEELEVMSVFDQVMANSQGRDAWKDVAEAEAAAKDGEACKCGITQLEPNELCSQHGGAKG